MNVRHQSILVSNHANWELSYEDSRPLKETHLKMVACLIGCTVAWPVFFLGAALFLPNFSFNYFKARWNQYKIINVLSNPRCLKEYSERRVQCCEKQIENLKSEVVLLMGEQLPKDKWKDFPWDKFLDTDFFQKPFFCSITTDKGIFISQWTLQRLEEVRTRINFLSHQKLVLSNPEGRLEAIKKIAKMSFVKNAFIRQGFKEWTIHLILWLLPSGIFWDLYFNSPTNDRLTYEGNKSFLPAGTGLEIYDDLVDAHNKLVRNNDFVVPYIEHKII